MNEVEIVKLRMSERAIYSVPSLLQEGTRDTYNLIEDRGRANDWLTINEGLGKRQDCFSYSEGMKLALPRRRKGYPSFLRWSCAGILNFTMALVCILCQCHELSGDLLFTVFFRNVTYFITLLIILTLSAAILESVFRHTRLNHLGNPA